jgi:hypothetical protein
VPDIIEKSSGRYCLEGKAMVKRFVICLLFLTAFPGFITGCDYGDESGNAQWKIPISGVPECLRNIVTGGDTDRWIGIPLWVYRYTYQNEYFYYLYADCCDQYNYLLDGECNIICAPDGGFSGAGDGQCPDYYQYLTSKQLIWCKDAETCSYLENEFRL